MIRFLLILSSLIFAQSGTSPTQADFFHHKQSGDPIEMWSYHFVFENGTQAWLNYSLVKLPAIGEKVAAELSFYQFQGKNHAVGKQFDRKEWKEDPAKATLHFRESYAMEKMPENGHRVRFSTTKNESYSLDLAFSDTKPGLTAPPQEIDGIKIYSVIHIPRGSVQGTISVGKQKITVKGTGSLVHTWHSKPVTDFAQRSVSLFSSEGSVLCGRLLQAKNGRTAIGYVVTEEQGKPKLLTPKTIDAKKNGATITWTDPSTPALSLDFSSPFQKYSSLSTVDSWFERQAAKVAMGGERILFRGKTKNPIGTIQWIAVGFDD